MVWWISKKQISIMKKWRFIVLLFANYKEIFSIFVLTEHGSTRILLGSDLAQTKSNSEPRYWDHAGWGLLPLQIPG